MKKTTSENSNSNQLLIIALVIVLLIIAFAVSGGLLKFSKNDIEFELKKQREDLKKRKQIIDEALRKMEMKRDDLLKLLRRVYFIARLLIVISWLSINWVFYKVGLLEPSIERFISLNGLVLIVVLIFFYLFKGVHTLKEVVSTTKLFFEDMVFLKHKSIHQEILMYKEESLKLEAKIIDLTNKSN